MDSDFWIKKLNLSQHPAGGFFGDIYRSNEKCTELPERYGENAERSSCSIIYSLLKEFDIVPFHRLKSDEIITFVQGDTASMYVIDNDTQEMEVKTLGTNEDNQLVVVVPAGNFFAIKLEDPRKGAYCLTTATVTPGFDIIDFEVADRAKLLAQYPEHSECITSLTFS